MINLYQRKLWCFPVCPVWSLFKYKLNKCIFNSRRLLSSRKNDQREIRNFSSELLLYGMLAILCVSCNSLNSLKGTLVWTALIQSLLLLGWVMSPTDLCVSIHQLWMGHSITRNCLMRTNSCIWLMCYWFGWMDTNTWGSTLLLTIHFHMCDFQICLQYFM